MSINLYSFVENPFTDKAYFNYDKFKDVVYKAQRLMDDIVDLEEEKINIILNKIENDPEPEEIKAIEKNLWIKIKTKLLDGRRTGLSGIGLGDVFGACNLVYGSNDSITLAEEIYKQFAISAYKSSIDMAKERGAFPIYSQEAELKNPFLERIEMHDLPRRNISCLTIPPSGSLSILAGISSGIEPVYQLYYKRRRKLEKGNPKITFVDQNGDGWEEYNVLHPKFDEWLTSLGENKPFYNNYEDYAKISPYYKSTAYEIDPIQRVKLQATIQQWIDHSISSTINLPEDVSEAEVASIYETAWKLGCKGITVYRDNCRTGVLISNNNKEEKEFKQHDAPKRPQILNGDIYTVKSKGKEWLVVIGLYNDNPYEIFALENKWNIKQYSVGDIIKQGKGKYDLNIKDDIYIENFLENISDEENNLTRMISTSLRHGANIRFVVEQLNKSRGDITSFTKVLARVLKKYIKENEQTKEICPECGANLIYKEGCKSCNQCGYSKCG